MTASTSTKTALKRKCGTPMISQRAMFQQLLSGPFYPPSETNLDFPIGGTLKKPFAAIRFASNHDMNDCMPGLSGVLEFVATFGEKTLIVRKPKETVKIKHVYNYIGSSNFKTAGCKQNDVRDASAFDLTPLKLINGFEFEEGVPEPPAKRGKDEPKQYWRGFNTLKCETLQEARQVVNFLLMRKQISGVWIDDLKRDGTLHFSVREGEKIKIMNFPAKVIEVKEGQTIPFHTGLVKRYGLENEVIGQSGSFPKPPWEKRHFTENGDDVIIKKDALTRLRNHVQKIQVEIPDDENKPLFDFFLAVCAKTASQGLEESYIALHGGIFLEFLKVQEDHIMQYMAKIIERVDEQLTLVPVTNIIGKKVHEGTIIINPISQKPVGKNVLLVKRSQLLKVIKSSGLVSAQKFIDSMTKLLDVSVMETMGNIVRGLHVDEPTTSEVVPSTSSEIVPATTASSSDTSTTAVEPSTSGTMDQKSFFSFKEFIEIMQEKTLTTFVNTIEKSRQQDKEDAKIRREEDKQEAETRRKEDEEKAEIRRKEAEEKAEARREEDKQEAEARRKEDEEKAKIRREEYKQEAEARRKADKEEAEVRRKEDEAKAKARREEDKEEAEIRRKEAEKKAEIMREESEKKAEIMREEAEKKAEIMREEDRKFTVEQRDLVNDRYDKQRRDDVERQDKQRKEDLDRQADMNKLYLNQQELNQKRFEMVMQQRREESEAYVKLQQDNLAILEKMIYSNRQTAQSKQSAGSSGEKYTAMNKKYSEDARMPRAVVMFLEDPVREDLIHVRRTKAGLMALAKNIFRTDKGTPPTGRALYAVAGEISLTDIKEALKLTNASKSSTNLALTEDKEAFVDKLKEVLVRDRVWSREGYSGFCAGDAKVIAELNTQNGL
ncbi:hypothetical protein AbHV_ORF76 [Abalone herpesvirus Victoria/AUS/2009]|uniref:Uncharacterized protein n=1 Tax=Abalone herpesvirus (isolate Abalone/Australia/Victoria/2009) TaxID=1241371 RepID=K4JYJ1_ABHV|nr:hypothetical protein AbHV_ORF76 [Abalone herpesvirus Victoria/AUS/2009]AFU90088.1 hypothetical protein AbHV_ORF76 [Abalone herpesvirus Victoria/AUS/2009]